MTIIDKTAMMPFEDNRLGLYIHIPFCLQKCLYCDFCSFPTYTEEMMGLYVKRITDEMKKYADRCGERRVDTVYFGGGTPTLLKERHFDSILGVIAKNFTLDSNVEMSCECNPATADAEFLKDLKNIGVNRLSIGLQSVNDDELKALGRIHTCADFVQTYKNARGAGFDNVSVDLMYGIPYQTVESFGYTLDFVSELSPEHISAYCLKIEEGTPFGKMRETLSLPNEDDEYDMYVLCTDLLAEHGYHKYEISNFSRDGYESKHNLKYWTQGDYLGFGVAAHSCFAGERFFNSRDIAAYISGEDITEEKRKIPPKELMAEYIMLRMRLTDGIELADFKARFGVELEAVCGDLDRYISAGYMQKCGSRVAFTDKGIFVSNSILSDILDFD